MAGKKLALRGYWVMLWFKGLERMGEMGEVGVVGVGRRALAVRAARVRFFFFMLGEVGLCAFW